MHVRSCLFFSLYDMIMIFAMTTVRIISFLIYSVSIPFRYLLHSQTRPRSINDIMPMIGARFYTQLDAAQMRSDVIENELSKVRNEVSKNA